MASDCSGASKCLVEELGGTSAGEALRAHPTGFGAALERYLKIVSPSEPKYFKKAPGLPRRSSLRSSFGQASVKLRSFHPYSISNPSSSPGNRLRLWSATNSVTIVTYPFQNRKLCTQCFTRTGPTQFRYKAFGCSTAVRRRSAWHAG